MKKISFKRIFSLTFLNLIVIFYLPLSVEGSTIQSILLKSQGASRTDFNAFLRMDTPYVSFESFYFKTRPYVFESEFKDLSEKDLVSFKGQAFKRDFNHFILFNKISLSFFLEEAQKAYLLGYLQKAKKYFQDIVSLSFLKDWNLEERKTIHYSFLRLSQMAKDKYKKREYLFKAQHFFPTHLPDGNLFPPAFIKAYKKLLTLRETVSWMPGESFRFFSSILINGEKYEAPFIQPIEIPKDEFFRISLISNSFLPISRLLNVKTLKALELKKTPLVRGTCEAPILEPSLFHLSKSIKGNIFIFFNPHCIQSLVQLKQLASSLQRKNTSNQKWNQQDKKGEGGGEQEKKRKIVLYPNQVNKKKDFASYFKLHSKAREKSFLKSKKSKWLWMSLGSLVITSAVIHFSYNQSEEPYIYSKRKRGF